MGAGAGVEVCKLCCIMSDPSPWLFLSQSFPAQPLESSALNPLPFGISRILFQDFSRKLRDFTTDLLGQVFPYCGEIQCFAGH